MYLRNKCLVYCNLFFLVVFLGISTYIPEIWGVEKFETKEENGKGNIKELEVYNTVENRKGLDVEKSENKSISATIEGIVHKREPHSYTVNDLRDLLGKDRIDQEYTEEEKEVIIRQYNLVEKENRYAEMFELNKKIDVSSQADKEYMQLVKEVEAKKEELRKAYMNGESAKDILEMNTTLEGLKYELSLYQDRGYSSEMEYVENKWTQEYMNIQENIEHINTDYVIGDIGSDLGSPIKNKFVIDSLFGMRVDPLDHNLLNFHKGLDLDADLDEPVSAVFNGVVSAVYTSETGGNTVEISHGKNLVTRYLHLDKIGVKVGQEIQQYDIIGLAGSTGTRSTGPHLHLCVILDDEYINPLYIFGELGKQGYLRYMERHNIDSVMDDKNQLEFKDKPTFAEALEQNESEGIAEGYLYVPTYDDSGKEVTYIKFKMNDGGDDYN